MTIMSLNCNMKPNRAETVNETYVNKAKRNRWCSRRRPQNLMPCIEILKPPMPLIVSCNSTVGSYEIERENQVKNNYFKL